MIGGEEKVILLSLKKSRFTVIEKYRLAKVLASFITMLLHCNKYLRQFKEVIDWENKITFK